MHPEAFAHLLAEHFPAGSRRATLSAVEVRDDLVMVLRLVAWSDQDGVRVIETIKDQPVAPCRPSQLDDPRLPAMVHAMSLGFTELVEARPDLALTLMPHELWFGAELLDLAKPQTTEDFVNALFSATSRYGGYGVRDA